MLLSILPSTIQLATQDSFSLHRADTAQDTLILSVLNLLYKALSGSISDAMQVAFAQVDLEPGFPHLSAFRG